MRKAILPIVVAAVLLALSFAPVADADNWDKKTVVTFNQDVEIPGQVLPAGTYVFKLLHSNSDRSIVQVWTDHEQQLIATMITVGDSYPNHSGAPYFVLDLSGTDEGYPPAVVSWFFAGSDEGRDFIYKGWSTTRMVDNEITYAAPQQEQQRQRPPSLPSFIAENTQWPVPLRPLRLSPTRTNRTSIRTI